MQNPELKLKTLKQIAVAANAEQPEPISDEMLWGVPQQTACNADQTADSAGAVEARQDLPEEVISLANTAGMS